MRPRFLTPRNLILILIAVTIFVGLSVWIKAGMPLPGAGVPSTAGKLAFVSDRAGNPDIWMMNGDGTDAVAITRDAVREDQPSWAESGKELAFIGAKSDTESPQVYIADATTGRNAVAVTRTSGAKSFPRWEGNQEVSFLDTGKLTSYDIAAQESHAIFPEADHKRAIAALFPRGGLDSGYQLGPHTYLLVINVEDGQLLLGYQFDHDHESDVQLVMLGQGEKIHVSPRASGGFVAAFTNGSPLPEPRLLMNAQLVQALSAQGGTDDNSAPLINAAPIKGLNIVAAFGTDIKVQKGVRLSFAPTEIQATPDDDTVVVATKGDAKNAVEEGVLTVALSDGSYEPIATMPASHLSVSPDGMHTAFQSGKDIYVVTRQGGEPKNVTQGQGSNSYPVWSPLLPETKK